MVLNYTRDDQRYISAYLVASELGLPICCLLSAMHVILGCKSVNSFPHTGKITTFQTLKYKLDELTDMESTSMNSPHSSHSRKCVCCYFNSICILLYDENKSGSNVSELRYSMFTKRYFICAEH